MAKEGVYCLKKIGVLLFGLLFMFAFSVSAAEASEPTDALKDVERVIEQANIEIDKKIADAQKEAEALMILADNTISIINQNNRLSDSEKEIAIKGVNQILSWQIDRIGYTLIKETDAIAAASFKYGADRGFLVECEYLPYLIGNKIFYVDPIRVVL